MNLLKETTEFLADNGKSAGDVRWVQTNRGWFSWREFAEVADFEYDDGYGSTEVNPTLYVVGDDWWLARGEYDGSEWWEFRRKPERPEAKIVASQKLLRESW